MPAAFRKPSDGAPESANFRPHSVLTDKAHGEASAIAIRFSASSAPILKPMPLLPWMSASIGLIRAIGARRFSPFLRVVGRSVPAPISITTVRSCCGRCKEGFQRRNSVCYALFVCSCIISVLLIPLISKEVRFSLPPTASEGIAAGSRNLGQ